MVGPTGSGSGAGGSGSLGSPLSVTQREIETSAWTEVNKQALGIVPDSIDIAFSQIDNRYSRSHIGTHTGYSAREGQPVLDHSISSVRVLQSPNPLYDDSWSIIYEKLVNQLPPGVLERFMQEQQKPLNERDPSFAATQNTFVLAAKILSSMAMHCNPPAPESLEAARTWDNQWMSLIAMRQSIGTNQELASKAQDFLEEQGANLPHHDDYQNAITTIGGEAELLKGVNLKTLLPQKKEAEQ